MRNVQTFILFLCNRLCMNLFRIMNIKEINRCLQLHAREIIECGHHIYVYRVHVNINILPLVESVTVDYHKKKKYHPRRNRG